jgi:hypothetical protein
MALPNAVLGPKDSVLSHGPGFLPCPKSKQALSKEDEWVYIYIYILKNAGEGRQPRF